MDAFAPIFFILTGLIPGLFISWFFFRRIIKTTESRCEAEKREALASVNERLLSKDERIEEFRSDFEKTALELKESRDTILQLRTDWAEVNTRREEEQKKSVEKLEELKSARDQLQESFKALSADALKSNNRAFLDLAREILGKYQQSATGELDKRKEAIGQLVDPIKESLKKVDGQIQKLEKDQTTSNSTLSEQLKNLLSSENQLKRETANLVTALRKPSVRGSWGELHLRQAVEYAGMLEHCDFTEQTSVTDEAGRRQRPDLIISMPNKRQLVVDAKAPMEAYLQAIESQSDEERDIFLIAHARQIRDKIKDLSAKQYWSQFESAPEFVVLFLPNEALFSAALEKDGTLINFGAKNRVIVATPTTFIALLMAVAYGWKQDQVADRARRLGELGQELYHRIQTFLTHFAGIGKNLNKAVESYNKTIRSAETRVLVTARKMKEALPGKQEKLKEPEKIETRIAPCRPVEWEDSANPDS